ncbi:MAG: DegV family protein [Clostridia bacterium]|nr:DegV family protein [Clostridia bacterium]
MANYVLTTCSTADVSCEHLKERDIDYLSFSYFVDGKEYKDDLGKSLSYNEFYQMMRDGSDTKTAQPNVEEVKEFFRPYLAQGKDIIHLMLSSGLSGAMASAKIAVEELEEEYPDRKIYVVDSLGASSGMALLADEMADLRDSGMDIDRLYSWAESNKLRVHHWFFSTDLTYFVKGGRVSKVAGWFGTILKICPLLNVDNNGKLIAREKIKGKAAVIKQIVKKMEENADGGTEYSGRCYISHSDDQESADAVKSLIEEKFPHIKGEVLINSIGTTIGSHTGPGTVAVFFMGKERIN